MQNLAALAALLAAVPLVFAQYSFQNSLYARDANMDAIKQAADYAASHGGGASKEANKQVTKDSSASLGHRVSASRSHRPRSIDEEDLIFDLLARRSAMDAIKNAADYVSDSVRNGVSGGSKESNKEVAKNSRRRRPRSLDYDADFEILAREADPEAEADAEFDFDFDWE